MKMPSFLSRFSFLGQSTGGGPLPARTGLWATNMESRGGVFDAAQGVNEMGDLPPRFLSLTHVEQGPIRQTEDSGQEVALIMIPSTDSEPERVVRLTVPGWLQRNSDNLSVSIELNQQIGRLGYSHPETANARREIIAAINGVDARAIAVNDIGRVDEGATQRESIDQAQVDKNPLNKLVFEVLRTAVEYSAADIHVETRFGIDPGTQRNGTRIRMRIDGDVEDIPFDLPELSDPATLRKMTGFIYNELCTGKSGQHFNPADFQSALMKDRMVGNELIRGRYQTFDVNLTRAPNGDKPFDLVLRILYADRIAIPTLSDLGFLPWQVQVLERFIAGKNRMACVSGKVGSGKSTTLRSLFAMLPERWKKYAAEDPNEYYHPNTTPINLSEDGAIQKVLKSLKRGDLDALLMGEVRTTETMSLVRNVAFSGHPAFTTTHAESALGQIPYFLSPEMGMEPYELANPSLIGVLFHQALVKKLCDCAHTEPSVVHAAVGSDRLRLLEDQYQVPIDKLRTRNEAGCPKCRKGIPSRYGYYGADVLAEMFEPEDSDLELIEQRKLVDLNRKWRSSHAPFDSDDCSGKTTLEVGIYKAMIGRLDIRNVEEKTRPMKNAKVYV